MNTEQDTRAIEAEIDALLLTLTQANSGSAAIQAELQTLDGDMDTLGSQLGATEQDVTEFMEEQDKELKTMIDEEEKEIAEEEV